MFAQGSCLILTKKYRYLRSSLLTNIFLFTSCLRDDDGYESSEDDTEDVDDDFDDNAASFLPATFADGDNDNSDAGEDGGGENGSDDSNMGMAKEEEIKTCITEERELPQEILEFSLAETVKGLAEPASYEMKTHA